MVGAARGAAALVRVEVRPGDDVVRGVPIGMAWSTQGGPLLGPSDVLAEGVRAALVLGYERTLDQDSGFGFR